MDKFCWMPNRVQSPFMSSDMNWGPLSLVIFLGIPCNFQICFRYMSINPFVDSSVVVGMRRIIFENWLITDKMALNPLDSGSGPIISNDMDSQGDSGGG